jgi:hypothetical protein
MSKHKRALLICGVLALLSFWMGKSYGQLTEEEIANRREQEKQEARLKAELAGLLRNPPDLEKLAAARVAAARKVADARMKEFMAGKVTPVEFFLDASRRLLDAELALDPGKKGRIAALERHWLVLRKAEEVNEAKFNVGTKGDVDFYPIVEARMEAEIALVKAKQE